MISKTKTFNMLANNSYVKVQKYHQQNVLRPTKVNPLILCSKMTPGSDYSLRSVSYVIRILLLTINV